MNILSTLCHAEKFLPERFISHITLSAQPAGRMLSIFVSSIGSFFLELFKSKNACY